MLHSTHPIQTNGMATQIYASVEGLISHIGTPVQLAERNAGVRGIRSAVSVPMCRHTLMWGTMSGLKEEIKRFNLPIHHITVIED